VWFKKIVNIAGYPVFLLQVKNDPEYYYKYQNDLKESPGELST